jgi:hypothetical protein
MFRLPSFALTSDVNYGVARIGALVAGNMQTSPPVSVTSWLYEDTGIGGPIHL